MSFSGFILSPTSLPSHRHLPFWRERRLACRLKPVLSSPPCDSPSVSHPRPPRCCHVSLGSSAPPFDSIRDEWVEHGRPGSFEREENPRQLGRWGDPSAPRFLPAPRRSRPRQEQMMYNPSPQEAAVGVQMGRKTIRKPRQTLVVSERRGHMADMDVLSCARDRKEKKRWPAVNNEANEIYQTKGIQKRRKCDAAAPCVVDDSCACAGDKTTDCTTGMVRSCMRTKPTPLSNVSSPGVQRDAWLPFSPQNQQFAQNHHGYSAIEDFIQHTVSAQLSRAAAVQTYVYEGVHCMPLCGTMEFLTDALYYSVNFVPGSKCKDTCTRLLGWGAMIASKDGKRSSLIAAVHRSKQCTDLYTVIDVFLEQDRHALDWEDSNGHTALHHAVCIDNLVATQKLTAARSAKFGTRGDKKLFSTCALSIRKGRYCHFDAILECCPDLDFENYGLVSSLVYGVQAGNLDQMPHQTLKLLTFLLNRGGASLRHSWRAAHNTVVANRRCNFDRGSLQCEVLGILWLYRYIQVDRNTCVVRACEDWVSFPHIRWSKATHHLFPDKFKEAFRTLLLCFHRAKHAQGNRDWSVLQLILPLFVYKHAYGDWMDP